MRRMKRLFGEIVVIILYLIGLPTSVILINDYVDEPAVDALGSGVILAGVRVLETAVAFALMFGVFLLMRKISRPRTGQ
jgi:hypothetical protein